MERPKWSVRFDLVAVIFDAIVAKDLNAMLEVFAADAGRDRSALVSATPHTSREFERELDVLGERLVTMGARAEQQVARAMKAIIDRDDALADEVIAGDAAINADENEVDGEALHLLARYQPVAADLRFIRIEPPPPSVRSGRTSCCQVQAPHSPGDRRGARVGRGGRGSARCCAARVCTRRT